MAMGIVGLFVGAIVPSVGYKLFLAWIRVVWNMRCCRSETLR